MLKNIVIGDIHGRSDWKKYIKEEFDNFYFVGDYFDSRDGFSIIDQITNFREICKVVRKDSRFHLCLGNHCHQYLRGLEPDYYLSCSGAQFSARFDIQEVLEANMDLIKIVYQIDDTLISHAGISNSFMKVLNLTNPLDINNRFNEYRTSVGWNGYDPKGYGNNKDNSCLWIRPEALLSDKLTGYKQIVGHTHFDIITTIDGITFTDNNNKEVYRFLSI